MTATPPAISFYERRGVNIGLVPGREEDSLILREKVWGGVAVKVPGCLRLRHVGGGLQGTWTSSDGQTTLPVSLAPLDVTRLPPNLPDSPGLRRLRASDPLTFLKLNRRWAAEAGGARIHEPLSGVAYPRVVGGSAPLNAALQDRQLEHAANALECRADRAGMTETTDEPYELSAAVICRSPRLVSVTERINYDCGGVHPDGYDVGLILDRATGRAVPVSTIWPGLTPARLRALSLARGKPEAE